MIIPTTTIIRFLSPALALVSGFALAKASPAEAQPFDLNSDIVVQNILHEQHRQKNKKQPVSLLVNQAPSMAQSSLSSSLAQARSLGDKMLYHVGRFTTNIMPDNVQFEKATPSFMSSSLNQGIDVEPAKMVGFTAEAGAFSFGSGYTWGEKNPALMDSFDEGFVVGVNYDANTVDLQMGIIKTGIDVGPVNLGGSQRQSVMMGANWQASRNVGWAMAVQYLDDKESSRHDGIWLTLGTRIEF